MSIISNAKFAAIAAWAWFHKKKAGEKLKGFLQSKTIWGIILMASPFIAKKLNIPVDQMNGYLEQGVELIGFILALVGRFTAKGPLAAAPLVK